MTGSWKFLVVGAGRGGTSLLSGLLDGHPGLELGFELYSNEMLAGRGVDPAVLAQENPATRLADRVANFRAACLRRAAKIQPGKTPTRLWGNKITTEHLRGLVTAVAPLYSEEVVLDYFFREALGDVKIIFILRDGRACVRSKVARTGQTVAQASDKWRFCARVYRHLFGPGAAPAGVCFVRFEELLAEPEQTLRGVCGFLGIEYDPAMLAGTQSDKMPSEYRRDGIDATRADAGPQQEDWQALIADDLRACGYPLPVG